jgi:ketosteroid isomerase-like protein
MNRNSTSEKEVRQLLVKWAESTRLGRTNLILANHASDALIFDVLQPLQYEGADAYKKSWGDWQPETQGEGKFGFTKLSVTANDDMAFATGIIECGGTFPDGRTFEDIVRATFCLTKEDGAWTVRHQHISKPMG